MFFSQYCVLYVIFFRNGSYLPGFKNLKLLSQTNDGNIGRQSKNFICLQTNFFRIF